MWFFDSVLDNTTTKTGTSQVSSTKKDDQDGSFLIISDDIKAETLPDTAVQIFENNTSDVAISSPNEVSFFSEPTTIETPMERSETPMEQKDEEVSQEVAFLEETGAIVAPVAEILETETDVLNTSEQTDNFVSFIAETAPEKGIITTETAAEKNDIYAPMKRAIAEYEKFLSALMEDASKEDNKIEISNAQIAEAKEIAKRAIDTAKESAKVALENRKRIDTEMKRIGEMKDLLSLQIK